MNHYCRLYEVNRLLCGILCPIIVILFYGCAPVTVNQFIADGMKPLSSNELREQLPGTKLQLEAIDFYAQVQFLPDGYLTAVNLEKQKEKGRWKVTEENRLCLKFNRWYFGDLKCYQLVKDGGNYIFFTNNGARYYTADILSTDLDLEGLASSSENSTVQRTERSSSPKNNSQTKSPPLTPAEKKQTLVRVARNCPGCNLAGANLKEAQLVAANLAGADLSGADLSGANLRRANLVGAKLTDARLVNTNLSGANLTSCDLSNSDLTGANLIRATATDANFDGAVLHGSHLESIQGMKY